MILADKYYKSNLKEILVNGNWDENPRPKWEDGSPAKSKFITQVFEKYDISKGEFPITTLRNTAIKTGIREVLWIYQDQDSSLETARKRKIFWWDPWDVGDGTIGTRYGATVKKWDLMNKLLKNLKEDPFSRRHIINMLQESDLKDSEGLYPCAYETIWSVRKNNNKIYLDLTLNQRSNDYIMAGYINKIQYVSLLLMVCGHLNYLPGKFSHFVQNLHIYDRHIEAAEEILNKKEIDIQPQLILNENKDFYTYSEDDFTIKGVKEISKISSKLEIAV